ncbi:MFS transporter [Kitasatospora sp. NPDC089797]|uniref:MFS transporter n=1 Tax=Kitasatospora sp. NPDC089797 TaxID=3155298 RepID=UPI003438F651
MREHVGSKAGGTGFPLITVLTLMAGIFAVGSEELVVSPLLVDVARSFDTSVSVAALSVSIYGIATAAGALLFAPLGDRVSRRLALTVGMATFLVGTVLCAFAGALEVFFAGRALAGLATGAFVPTAYAFVGDRVRYEHRARAMGIIVSSWSFSLVVGVPMGSFVGQWSGWRAAFGLLAVLGAVVAGLLLVDGRSGRAEAAEGPRPAPAAGAGSGAGTQPGPSRSVVGVLRLPKVSLYVLATFLNMLGFYGMYTFVGSALQYRFGDGSPLTGVMILLYGLGFSTSFVTGRWADRFGKERVLLVLLVGLVPTLTILPRMFHLTVPLVLCLFVWGAMQSLVVTLLSTLLSECSEHNRGTILAFYSLATNLGVALGAAALGPLFTAHGFGAVGLACSAITLVAFLLVGWVYRRRGEVLPVGDGASQQSSPVEVSAHED